MTHLKTISVDSSLTLIFRALSLKSLESLLGSTYHRHYNRAWFAVVVYYNYGMLRNYKNLLFRGMPNSSRLNFSYNKFRLESIR